MGKWKFLYYLLADPPVLCHLRVYQNSRIMARHEITEIRNDNCTYFINITLLLSLRLCFQSLLAASLQIKRTHLFSNWRALCLIKDQPITNGFIVSYDMQTDSTSVILQTMFRKSRVIMHDDNVDTSTLLSKQSSWSCSRLSFRKSRRWRNQATQRI